MFVVKGAYYFDDDKIVQPHYTGEFYATDCNIWITLKELKGNYSSGFIAEAKNDYLTHEGTKYYRVEVAPCHTEDFELLSDLSDLQFTGKF